MGFTTNWVAVTFQFRNSHAGRPFGEARKACKELEINPFFKVQTTDVSNAAAKAITVSAIDMDALEQAINIMRENGGQDITI